MSRYEIEPEMILTAPDNDGRLGHRRVRVLAKYPEGGWIIEDLPSRMRGWPSGLTRIPEENLRIVFEPEEPSPMPEVEEIRGGGPGPETIFYFRGGLVPSLPLPRPTRVVVSV